MKKLIRSQSFDLLGQCLSLALEAHSPSLQRQWIIVPTISLKGWLFLKLASLSSSRGISGVKICTLDELLYAEFRQIPTKLEMRGLIYDALSQEWSEDLSAFLSSKPRSKLELANQLADLFFSYGRHELDRDESWQMRLYKALFSSGSFLMPNQILPKASWTKDHIHCFGFDSLPPIFWNYLSSAPSSIFYLFSPTVHYWEDVCTDKEQMGLSKMGKKRGVSYDEISAFQALAEKAPPLLANLGKLGRETLKILDPLGFDEEPLYNTPKDKTVLASMQREILSFEKEEPLAPDGSIRIFMTGASKLREVEILSDEILRLNLEKKIPFSEMAILAPDIHAYVPIIEYVFSSRSLPYRFPYVSVEKQSSFHQGILRLISLCYTPWTEEKLTALFETASFSKKANLNSKEVLLCTSWLREIFQHSSSWEEGFMQILKKATTLFLGPKRDAISINSLDLLERSLQLLQSLWLDFANLADRSFPLEKWASLWDGFVQKYLRYDYEDEKDTAAQEAFYHGLKSMQESFSKLDKILFPFEMIEDFLKKPIYTSIHGNHLHAIFCASIQEGTIIPMRASFMIGMDEEGFPRKNIPSSLDLFRKDPDPAQIDRYTFLQILLNTKEALYFSYGHLSEEEGKTVGPSLLVQELMHHLKDSIEVVLPKSVFAIEKSPPFFSFGWQKGEQVEETLFLSDLVSFTRHPWKYYLQKVHQIYLEDRLDRSFGAKRSMILKSSLEWPLASVFDAGKERLPGMFQEAFILDVSEKERLMREQLSKWGKKMEPLSLTPPIEMRLGDGSILRIVGDIPLAVEDGAFHFGDDKINALLKVWPEILASCITLKTANVYMLKTGKIKAIENPKEALKKFLEYYLRCRKDLSPLIPDWADSLLRKTSPLKFEYDDVVNEWMEKRLEIPSEEKLAQEWKWLKTTFSDLIALYPARGAIDESV